MGHPLRRHAAAAQVTKAAVEWGPGDGTLTVYLAGPAGAVESQHVATARAWILANKPGTDNPTVQSATAIPVMFSATVRVNASADSTANRALATDALSAYVAGLAIGEDVDLAALYHAIYRAVGLIDVDITQPSDDVSISNGQIATITISITWTAV